MTEGASYRGRPVSWVAVVIILAGFTLGGIALVAGTWWLFWVAVGVVVVGGILAVAVDIFADVELDHLHGADEDTHAGPVEHEVTGRTADALEPAASKSDADASSAQGTKNPADA